MERIISRCLNALSLLLIICVFFTSCDVVEEENVSDKTVVLLTPPDDHVSSQFTVAFKWQEIEEADFYRIQIATPDFESPIEYVVDSLVSATQRDFTLETNVYEWRVRAENVNSHSAYSTRALTIDEIDITGQDIVLNTPADQFITGNEEVDFDWEDLPSTESYTFQLYNSENGGTGDAVGSPMTTFNSALSTMLEEGEFFWSVTGIAGQNQSNTTYREITVDLTAPDAPVLSAPLDGESTVATDFEFSWSSGSDNLTNTVDSLLIFEDSNLNQLTLGIEASSNSVSADLSDLISGDYYWIISRSDEAGNFADSATRQLIIL